MGDLYIVIKECMHGDRWWIDWLSILLIFLRKAILYTKAIIRLEIDVINGDHGNN